MSAHHGHWELLVPLLTHHLHRNLSSRPVCIAYKPLHFNLTNQLLLNTRTAAAR